MRRQDVQDATGRSEYNPGYGQMRAWGKAPPVNGQGGFSPGCLYQNLTGGVGAGLYVNVGTFLSSQWNNVDLPVSNQLVTLTATTTMTPLVNAGHTMLLSNAGGFTVNMAPATGTGNIYYYTVNIVSATGYVFTANGTDKFKGSIQIGVNSATPGQSCQFTSTINQNVTLNGTTKGGAAIGDWLEFQDISAGVWSVTGLTIGSGTLATPFS